MISVGFQCSMRCAVGRTKKTSTLTSELISSSGEDEQTAIAGTQSLYYISLKSLLSSLYALFLALREYGEREVEHLENGEREVGHLENGEREIGLEGRDLFCNRLPVPNPISYLCS